MTLRRAVAVAATAGLILLFPAAPVRASGGGGCGERVTNESGTEVAIKDFCFTPTVLFTEPGDSVTWTNMDRMPHNVGGANLAWGSFEQFRKGRSVSYSFSTPGVYSYVCTIHPGMVGTIVVGDPAPSGATATDAVRRIKNVSAVQTTPVRSGGTSDGAAVWFAMTAIAVAMGGLLVGGKVVRRRARA